MTSGRSVLPPTAQADEKECGHVASKELPNQTRREMTMKKFVVYFLMVVLSSFVSCTHSKMMTITPDYRNTALLDRSLLICLVPNTVHVNNAYYVNDSFGEGDSMSLYLEFFKAQLPVSMKDISRFKTIGFGSPQSTNPFHSTSFVTAERDSFDVMLPDAGTTVELDGQTPEIVLFVQDLTTETVESFHWNANGGYSAPALMQKANCVFWDNRSGKVILFGQVESQAENFFPTFTKGLWEKGLDGFARTLIKQSPFYSTPE